MVNLYHGIKLDIYFNYGKHRRKQQANNLCSIELGLHKSNIISCLKKRISQTAGYMFKYK